MSSKPSCQASIEAELSLGSVHSSSFSVGSGEIDDGRYHAEVQTEVCSSSKQNLLARGVLKRWKSLVHAAHRTQLAVSIVTIICVPVISVIVVDTMLKRDRQAMKLITFADYTFCTFTALLAGGKSILLQRNIPAKWHAAFAILTFLQNSLKTAATGLGIPMLILLVVKNAGLPCSILADFLVLQERFSSIQMLGAAMVTLAIMQVLATKHAQKQSQQRDALDNALFLPVVLLLASELVRQVGNSLGQHVAKIYGRHYNERLFYQCAGCLSMLLLHQGQSWIAKTTTSVCGVGVPVTSFLLMINMLLSYPVKSSSLRIATVSNATVLSITLTAGRALSITVSAIRDSPPYPLLAMWFGVTHVVVGAAAFAVAPRARLAQKKVK